MVFGCSQVTVYIFFLAKMPLWLEEQAFDGAVCVYTPQVFLGYWILQL